MKLGQGVELFLAHPIPIRPTIGDGDIGGRSVDSMVSIGVDGIVHALE